MIDQNFTEPVTGPNFKLSDFIAKSILVFLAMIPFMAWVLIQVAGV